MMNDNPERWSGNCATSYDRCMATSRNGRSTTRYNNEKTQCDQKYERSNKKQEQARKDLANERHCAARQAAE